MEYFVENNSIVRKIWGKSDTVLFIFAGGAAEFAVNKAVDWLYFTGRLPADPLGRLFSTVTYARHIVFAEKGSALKTIDKMASIHSVVEKNRGAKIPDWAYRDVLFMLIYYSIRSYEVLERKLTMAEKEEVFNVFYRVGKRMGLQDLPGNYREWLVARNDHLDHDILGSQFTKDLYKQYHRQLGTLRYHILLETQSLLVPRQVKKILGLGKFSLIRPILPVYKCSKLLKLDWFVKSLLLPPGYKKQVKEIDAAQ